MARSGKSKVRAAGKGSLLLIAGLMLSSATVRVFTSAETAFAQSDLANQLLRSATNDANVKAEPVDRPAVTSLLNSLRSREMAVAQREQKLDVRAKSLEVAQREIERRLVALEQAEIRLSETLSLASTAAEDDLAQLTNVYENMKPKDAAAVFEAMEPEFAAGFLARMRPDTAAKVMSGLDPSFAYSVSAILAGRNANTPKN